MNSMIMSVLIVPGVVAFLLFLVFTYLHVQSRQSYFRAWQIGWAAYTLHFVVAIWTAYRGLTAMTSVLTSLLILTIALCILVSTRLIRRLTASQRREKFHLRWYEIAFVFAAPLLAGWDLKTQTAGNIFRPDTFADPYFHVDVVLAGTLLYCSFYFYLFGRRRNSVAFRLLALSLFLWTPLIILGQFQSVSQFGVTGNLLGPIPQMLLGIAMVMVLFENERDAVQENALAFSTLGVDPKRLLSVPDLVPAMQSILDRLIAPLPSTRAVIYISEPWRAIFPSVERGFSREFLDSLEKSGAGEYIHELSYRRGGFVAFRNVRELAEPLPAFPASRFEEFRRIISEAGVRNITAVSIQTRERSFGVILFPEAGRAIFGSSNLRLLSGLALQIGLALENYVVMHDAQRRTKEYELLTQIGQVVSSRLDQDEILLAIQTELGRIFDTSNFYVAFRDGENLRFELEVENGKLLPKHSRNIGNGLTEYIIRTGEPLLIRSDFDKTRMRLDVTLPPKRPIKCFCGVPIIFAGKSEGAMVTMNPDREYAFEQRDLEVLQTAAGQVSVAVENARLFAEEQRRSKQFSLLNSISKTAISSEDSEQMLAEIVGHIHRNFPFNHVGIGIVDYTTKDIEIRAEAGTKSKALGTRVPLGTGIIGRVARSGETALVQTSAGGQVQGILPNLALCVVHSDSLWRNFAGCIEY